MRLSSTVIAQLASVATLTVDVGDVFFIPQPTARYFDSTSARPALVVRVQRTESGEATLAHLVYGTTKRVPRRRAMPVSRGEAGLSDDTTFDFGPRLELPVAELVATARPLGRLDGDLLEELERSLAASSLSCRRLPR